MLVQIDVEPRGGAYVEPSAVVAIVPRPEQSGCWVMMKGGQRIVFPGDIEQAYQQLFDRDESDPEGLSNISSSQHGRDRLGPRVVPDELSGRHLSFGKPFDTKTRGIGAAVFMDVMSDEDPDEDRPSRKICQMLVPLHELRRIIDLLEAEIAQDAAE